MILSPLKFILVLHITQIDAISLIDWTINMDAKLGLYFHKALTCSLFT